MKSFLSLLRPTSLGVTLLLLAVATTTKASHHGSSQHQHSSSHNSKHKRSSVSAFQEDDGDKRLVLFAGPHFSSAKQVDQFFVRHRYVPTIREWIWPVEYGPEAHSEHDHSKRDMFSHLVLEADNETLMDEMYASIGDQWKNPRKVGMFLGTEEFDRVGTVPYSHLDGQAAMERVIDAVNLTNNIEDVTVVVNYRAPRLDQWVSVFDHEVRGRDHYKGFICSRNQDTGDYEMLWETLDTAMNPLNLVKEYRKLGLKVVLIDMSGVDKQKLDIAHVIACDVMEVNCTTNPGWVNGVPKRTTEIPDIDRDLLSLGSYDKDRLEKLFRRRDCTYEKELTDDAGVKILYQETLWKGCKEEKIHPDMVPHLQDTTSMFSAIRSQKGCNHGMSMENMLEIDDSPSGLFSSWWMTTLVVVLLATAIGIMVYKLYEYRIRYSVVSMQNERLEAIDRLEKASKLQPYKEAEELLNV